MNLPSDDECKFFIDFAYKMPSNIVAHSIQVNKVAVFLAKRFNEKNEAVNIDLVDKASILHDVLKIVEIHNEETLFTPPGGEKSFKISEKDRMKWIELKKKYSGLSHEEAAYEIFKEKYPEMATIIRKHGYHFPKGELKLNSWEEKIVYYADKRVTHSNIVSLKERLDEGHARYAQKRRIKGIDKEYQTKTDKFVFELEKEIFNKIGLSPDKLTEDMKRFEGN